MAYTLSCPLHLWFINVSLAFQDVQVDRGSPEIYNCSLNLNKTEWTVRGQCHFRFLKTTHRDHPLNCSCTNKNSKTEIERQLLTVLHTSDVKEEDYITGFCSFRTLRSKRLLEGRNQFTVTINSVTHRLDQVIEIDDDEVFGIPQQDKMTNIPQQDDRISIGNCSVNLDAKDWTVAGICKFQFPLSNKNSKNFREQSCAWRIISSGNNESITLDPNLTSKYIYGIQTFVSGTCAFKPHQLNNDVQGPIRFIVAVASVEHRIEKEIITEEPLEPATDCPHHVFKGDTVTCYCGPNPAGPGRPPATVGWRGLPAGDPVVVSNLSSSHPRVVHVCCVRWGDPKLPLTRCVNHTFLMAEVPLEPVTDCPSNVTAGDSVTCYCKANPTASGRPPATVRWRGLPAGEPLVVSNINTSHAEIVYECQLQWGDSDHSVTIVVNHTFYVALQTGKRKLRMLELAVSCLMVATSCLLFRRPRPLGRYAQPDAVRAAAVASFFLLLIGLLPYFTALLRDVTIWLLPFLPQSLHYAFGTACEWLLLQTPQFLPTLMWSAGEWLQRHSPPVVCDVLWTIGEWITLAIAAAFWTLVDWLGWGQWTLVGGIACLVDLLATGVIWWFLCLVTCGVNLVSWNWSWEWEMFDVIGHWFVVCLVVVFASGVAAGWWLRKILVA